jgi:hypothetical protein
VIEVIRLAGAEADIQAAYERLEDLREGAGNRFCANWIAAQAWLLDTRPLAVVTEGRSENSWSPVTRMAFSTPFSPRGWWLWPSWTCVKLLRRLTNA